MNFLQLCQRTRQEGGMSGSGPSSVIGQTGEMSRVVEWVRDAWTEAQGFREWNFMRADFSFTTINGLGTYTAASVGISNLKRWCAQPGLDIIELDASAMVLADYYRFRDAYLVGTQTDGKPAAASVSMANALLLGPVPDGAYSVTGKYIKQAEAFASNTDTPSGIADEFHKIIVYGALMQYARYEGVGDLYAEAQARYEQLLARMASVYLPQVTF